MKKDLLIFITEKNLVIKIKKDFINLDTVSKHYLRKRNWSNSKKTKFQNFDLSKTEKNKYIREKLYFKYRLPEYITNSYKKKEI